MSGGEKIMQREKILRELFNGKVDFSIRAVIDGSDYHNHQVQFSELLEKLQPTLNAEEKELLDLTIFHLNKLKEIETEEIFIEGFKIGARIIIETFEKNEEQFKSISD